MTKDEALRLALEALERYVNEDEVMEGMRGNEPWVETKRMGEKAITTIKAALLSRSDGEAKDEPVAWKWHQAPVKTSWGDGMVVADLAIDKDHTVSIYCEHDQTAKVEAMFTQPQQEAKDEPTPVAKNEGGRITWMIDDWPQNCLLYTHPPQSFTYEQVKAHIRAASMSANDISVGSDTTEDGVSIVIRRRDELLYAEFFAYTPPQRKPLSEEEIGAILEDVNAYGTRLYTFARAIEAAHGIKGEK